MVLFYLGSVSFWSYFKCISFHCLNCQKWAEMFLFCFFFHTEMLQNMKQHITGASPNRFYRELMLIKTIVISHYLIFCKSFRSTDVLTY